MCICLFAKQRALKIIYGSESVWLAPRTGHPRVAIDLLVQNMSQSPIAELSCLMPQKLFNDDGSIPVPRVYRDITEDMLNPDSPFASEVVYDCRLEDGVNVLRLEIPDPTDTTRNITNKGTFRGNNEIKELFDKPEKNVLLGMRNLSAVVIHLGTPIEPDESRWLRLYFRPLSGPATHRTGWRLVWAYLINSLHMSFNVSGPAKVRYDVKTKLANLRIGIQSREKGELRGRMLADLDEIWRDLVEAATKHPETQVELVDWRTRFFQWPMEPFSSIQSEGPVRVAGMQPNIIHGSVRSAYYEWTAGTLQIAYHPEGVAPGHFTVRFSTKYVPMIHKVGPLLTLFAFILAVIGLALAFLAS